MRSKIRSALIAPLFIAGWALVAATVVACSLCKRDKPRQKKSGKDPPDGYITRVRRSNECDKVESHS
jgi:hypothetical protein